VDFADAAAAVVSAGQSAMPVAVQLKLLPASTAQQSTQKVIVPHAPVLSSPSVVQEKGMQERPRLVLPLQQRTVAVWGYPAAPLAGAASARADIPELFGHRQGPHLERICAAMYRCGPLCHPISNVLQPRRQPCGQGALVVFSPLPRSSLPRTKLLYKASLRRPFMLTIGRPLASAWRTASRILVRHPAPRRARRCFAFCKCRRLTIQCHLPRMLPRPRKVYTRSGALCRAPPKPRRHRSASIRCRGKPSHMLRHGPRNAHRARRTRTRSRGVHWPHTCCRPADEALVWC